MRFTKLVLAFVFTVLAASLSTQATERMPGNGQGKGLTKIDFKASTETPTNSRLFVKGLIPSGALPDDGNKSHNDDMHGLTLTLSIGSATFSGVADEKGRVRATLDGNIALDGKVTGNGKGFQVKVSGLNLQTLFPLDATAGSHSVTVAIGVTASKTDSTVTPPVTTTYTLMNSNVTFNYAVKGASIKGNNF